MYDRSTLFWKLLQSVMDLLPPLPSGRDFRPSLIASANQRFYRQMLLAAKVWRKSGGPCSQSFIVAATIFVLEATYVRQSSRFYTLTGSTIFCPRSSVVHPPVGPSLR